MNERQNHVILDSSFIKSFNRRNQAFSPLTLETSPIRKAKFLKTHHHYSDPRGTLFEFKGSEPTHKYHIKIGSEVKRCDYIYGFAPKSEQLIRCVFIAKHKI